MRVMIVYGFLRKYMDGSLQLNINSGWLCVYTCLWVYENLCVF